MRDKFVDECGVFGCIGGNAGETTLAGLRALQHRGQDAAGIAYADAGRLRAIKILGTASELAQQARRVGAAGAAIGHVRYSTCGANSLENAQPFVAATRTAEVAVCHNGHIVNGRELREQLEGRAAFEGTSDSELLLHKIAAAFTDDVGRAIDEALADVTPAYSLLVLTADALCATRDPFGMRPLVVGRGDGWICASSESCALDAVGASVVREVDPGETIVIDRHGLRSIGRRDAPSAAQCIFELIYFARPDSVMFGHSVARVRLDLGVRLAAEAPADADVVTPVPDSAIHGAIGYANASGIPLTMAFHRNAYVGRTFIAPDAAAREAAVRAKLAAIPSLVRDRRVVVVDDSIVRGTTCRNVIQSLRQAGAREVHVRVASPPTIGPCYFGIDTPDPAELFATGRDDGEMARSLDADSIQFLSLDGLMAVVLQQRFCAGCFSGRYPVAIPGGTAPLRWQLQRDIVPIDLKLAGSS